LDGPTFSTESAGSGQSTTVNMAARILVSVRLRAPADGRDAGVAERGAQFQSNGTA